jgi:hypothetical protein
VQGDTIGALNLYSRHSAAFDEYDRAVGAVLAAHAAIAMSAAHEHERAEQMEDALRSNREIGMAIGVLMGRGGMTQDDAFTLLRRASQHLNRKLGRWPPRWSTPGNYRDGRSEVRVVELLLQRSGSA